jgi:hypothetical protein
LETLCLKHCSDLAALSLRGCVSLQELHAGECGQLSNEGFGCLRGLRALQRLQMEGASQVGILSAEDYVSSCTLCAAGASLL